MGPLGSRWEGPVVDINSLHAMNTTMLLTPHPHVMLNAVQLYEYTQEMI